MPRRNSLKRTVSFWQLVRAADRSPLEAADWKSALSKWARARALSHDIDGVRLTGRIHTIAEVDHLVITKARDDLPRQQHRDTGEVADMEVRAEEWDVIESAFIAFLDFGNVFGFLQSANTAPSPQAVAKWINATKVASEVLAAEPVIDHERWNNVRRAGGVTMLDFAGPTSVLADAQGPMSHLTGLGQMGEYKFELSIKASRARGEHPERRRLYEMAEALIQSIGLDRVSKAKAKIYDDSDEGIPPELVNLLKQRYSRKETVQMLDRAGGARAVSEVSAFGAILAIADQLRRDLRRSVGAD